MTSEGLRGTEVLQILIVSKYSNGSTRALQVVPPNFEGFKDGEQLLVMNVVVELHRSEHARVKTHGVDVILKLQGEDGTEHIVRSISFHYQGDI